MVDVEAASFGPLLLLLLRPRVLLLLAPQLGLLLSLHGALLLLLRPCLRRVVVAHSRRNPAHNTSTPGARRASRHNQGTNDGQPGR